MRFGKLYCGGDGTPPVVGGGGGLGGAVGELGHAGDLLNISTKKNRIINNDQQMPSKTLSESINMF